MVFVDDRAAVLRGPSEHILPAATGPVSYDALRC